MSRKPVGTPARAAGKRAASVPARLRPLDNTPYRRTQAQGNRHGIQACASEIALLVVYRCGWAYSIAAHLSCCRLTECAVKLQLMHGAAACT